MGRVNCAGRGGEGWAGGYGQGVWGDGRIEVGEQPPGGAERQNQVFLGPEVLPPSRRLSGAPVV